MLNRISTTRITGLITEPNDRGVYPPGACQVANNVWFRDIGIVDSALDVGPGYLVGATGKDIIHAQPLSNGSMLWICQNRISGETEIFAGTQPLMPAQPLTSLNDKFDPHWVSTMVMRDRVFINGIVGVYCVDSLNPTAFTHVRRCGVVQPQVYSVGAATISGAGIPAGISCGYRGVLRKKMGNYEIVSPPSIPIRIWSATAYNTNLFTTSSWVTEDDPGVEYWLDIYRSTGDDQGTTAPDLTVSPIAPYNRVLSRDPLTGGILYEPTRRSLVLVDYQEMAAPYYQSSGTGLYTDDSNEGPLAISFAPPGCKVMGSWNDQAFYGNVLDRPQLSLKVPGGVGYNSGGGSGAPSGWGPHGIGKSLLTVTLTSGSPSFTVTSGQAGIFAYGQQIESYGVLPPNTRILSVVGNTVTCTANATSTGSVVINVNDMISINGVEVPIDSYQAFQTLVSIYNLNGKLELYASDPLDKKFSAIDVTLVSFDGRPFTIKATRGANYSPQLPDWEDTALTVSAEARPNILKWSKPDEPEAVPLGNSTSVGSGEILAFQSTKDSAFVFCSDGVYQLLGYSNNFVLQLVAKDYVVSSPKATVSMLDRVFAITNRGLIEVTAQGVQELSNGVFDPQALGAQYAVAGAGYQESDALQLHGDPTNRELVLLLKGVDSSHDSQLIVYNLLNKAFSTIQLTNSRITTLGYNKTTGTPGEPGNLWVCTRVSDYNFPKASPWVGGAPLEPTVLLQPFYGQTETEVFTSKKWGSVEWIYEKVLGAPTVHGLYETAAEIATTGSLRASNDLSKVRFGTPRSLARRTAISPGIHIPSPTVQYRLKGVSVLYSPINIKGDKVK